MKRKSIKDFFQENPDERVVALVNRYLSGVDLDGCDVLLVSDANVLDGIANEGSFRCVASSAALNDYVRVNKSLAKIYRLLNSRGVFVGHVETSEQYGARVSSRYNFIVAKIIILFSFVFERVIPKLFGLRHVIDKFGLNKHHRLTKCEALGRLRYCGFQILKLTMHAYANYIHDYVLDNLEIDNNGKVVRDFGVPGWGKILRKFWLDEMPQLFNILKGELTFIGLRHLSREFLELYPEDWRNERMKLRPGFVPPYYADCPKTFEDIIESEKRYYRLKKKYPITTDVYYFIRVVINFLTLKARTG